MNINELKKYVPKNCTIPIGMEKITDNLVDTTWLNNDFYKYRNLLLLTYNWFSTIRYYFDYSKAQASIKLVIDELDSNGIFWFPFILNNISETTMNFYIENNQLVISSVTAKRIDIKDFDYNWKNGYFIYAVNYCNDSIIACKLENKSIFDNKEKKNGYNSVLECLPF